MHTHQAGHADCNAAVFLPQHPAARSGPAALAAQLWIPLVYSPASLRALCLVYRLCSELRLEAEAGLAGLSWAHSTKLLLFQHFHPESCSAQWAGDQQCSLMWVRMETPALWSEASTQAELQAFFHLFF